MSSGFSLSLGFFTISTIIWICSSRVKNVKDRTLAMISGSIFGGLAIALAYVGGWGTLPPLDQNTDLLERGGAYKVLAEVPMPDGKGYAQLIKRQDKSVIAYRTSMSLPMVFTYTPTNGKSHFTAIEER